MFRPQSHSRGARIRFSFFALIATASPTTTTLPVTRSHHFVSPPSSGLSSQPFPLGFFPVTQIDAPSRRISQSESLMEADETGPHSPLPQN